GHRVVPTAEGRLLLREQALQDLQRLLERLETPRDGHEVEAEGLVLELEPARPDAEVQAAAAHLVDGRRHLSEDARVPVGVARDEVTDARSHRRLRERREERPPFQTGALRIDEDREEVVERPERVVAPVVGALPEVEEGGPFDELLPRLETEADRMR